MLNADTIESINCEQLVTATDRLLLRGGRVSRRRPTLPSLVDFARGTQPNIQLPPSLTPVQPTVVTRAARASRSQAFAVTVVIPALVGIAVGLVALL